jgi:plastocyanin
MVMRARVWPLVPALALLAGACSGDDTGSQTVEAGPVGRQTYTVAMDAPSPEGRNIQLSAYFPASIRARPGDTIVFENRSNQAPHTVTFGVKTDRSNSPPFLTKAGQFNPAVFGRCYTESDPTPALEACPRNQPAQSPAFTGKGYWNSGALAPTVAPAGHDTKLSLDPSIAPGSYPYVCVLHGFMAGTLMVAESEADRERSKDVTTAGERLARQAAAAAAALSDTSASPTGAAKPVATGWGDKLVSVNRFNPTEVEVKAGETVAWIPLSPYEPHTVTFESPFLPDDPRAAPPAGVKSGAAYAGGFSNSGVFGNGPFPTGPFTLRFTKAGTYPYVCVLHPGMAGQVKVT